MAMRAAPMGTREAPQSEWDRNIRRAIPRPYDASRSRAVGAATLAFEGNTRRVLAFETRRRYLGNGTGQVGPNEEVSLPRTITAATFMQRLVGVEEGESIELLPKDTFQGYRGKLAAPERVFVYRRSPAGDDFVITPDRVVRVRVKVTRAIFL